MRELSVRHGKNPDEIWTLRASEAGIAAEREGQEYLVRADELGKRATLLDGMLIRGVLSLDLGRGGKDAFRLEDPSITELLRGLGPDLAVRWLLGRRVRAFVALAILFLVSSLPISGDPDAGIEPVPADWLGGLLGLGLLVLAGAARYRPTAWLFVLDAGWLSVLAIRGVLAVATDGASPLWLLLYALLVGSALTAIRTYRRLRAAGAPE